MRDGSPVARIQLRDQLRDEVGMLGSFLDRGEAGAGGLALPRVARGSIGRIRLRRPFEFLLSSFLLFQQVQAEVPQSIGAEPAALEALVTRY